VCGYPCFAEAIVAAKDRNEVEIALIAHVIIDDDHGREKSDRGDAGVRHERIVLEL